MTGQQPIEFIHLRQWAAHIAVAVYLVDASGRLVYYNETAARLLGRPYDEAEELTVSALASDFATLNVTGQPLAAEDLPLAKALAQRQPCHGQLRFRALDGAWYDIEVTAFPIEAVDKTLLGAAALFWEAGG